MFRPRAVRPGDVYVRSSTLHGRGVFAARRFGPGDVIEECPVLVVHPDDRPALDEGSLAGYHFEWQAGWSAVALGFGSLYNHSDQPNAAFEPDHGAGVIRYTAVRGIPADAEITVSYGVELWFDTIAR